MPDHTMTAHQPPTSADITTPQGRLDAVLGDPGLTWTQRRTRIQGWRGAEADRADALPGAQRLSAAVCAVGAATGAVTGSPVLLTALALTAVAGTVGPNPPFEWIHNRIAAARARPVLPPNRAAKRLACAIGAVVLSTSAAAMALDAPMLGLTLALLVSGTSAVVAVTGLCLPSVVFTVVWGPDRAAAPSLLAAARKPSEWILPTCQDDVPPARVMRLAGPPGLSGDGPARRP